MDFWEFAARSEWPIVAAGTVWLLRRSLRDMIDRTNPTKVDAWGLKAEFEKTLAKVEMLTPPAEQKAASPLAKDAVSIKKEEMPAILPTAIVLDAWRQLETAIRLKISPNPIYILKREPTREEFEREFSEDEIVAYQELKKLRNQVAHHDMAVSNDEAIRFKKATERLLLRIAAKEK